MTRSIIFSAEMIRALRGKSQTRRIVKPAPPRVEDVVAKSGSDYHWINSADIGMPQSFRPVGPVWAVRDLGGPSSIKCPYGKPGDVLYVRETWRPEIAHSHGMDACDCADVNVTYAADGESRFFRDDKIHSDWLMPDAAKWGNVSPIHMPEWAARYRIKLTNVRVERLQDISDADIHAEGISDEDATNNCRATAANYGLSVLRHRFACLWERINGPASWNANPHVWVLLFEIVR